MVARKVRIWLSSWAREASLVEGGLMGRRIADKRRPSKISDCACRLASVASWLDGEI